MASLSFLPPRSQSILYSSYSIRSFTHILCLLCENSIDARASMIQIHIDMDSFQITIKDNGSGITKQKREEMEQDKIHYDEPHQKFGYRRQSLLDISGLATLQFSSKTSASRWINSFSIKDRTICPIFARQVKEMEEGTKVVVSEIFERIPVKKKGMKLSEEIMNFQSILTHISMLHEDITLYLTCSTPIYNYMIAPGNVSTSRNLVSLLTCNQACTKFSLFCSLPHNSFRYVEGGEKEISIKGIWIENECHVFDKELGLLYINKRWCSYDVVENLIKKMYQDAFRSSEAGKYGTVTKRFQPVYMLHIQCPYDDIDIQFGTKNYEISCRNEERVLSVIRAFISKEMKGKEMEAKKESEKPELQLYLNFQQSNFKHEGEEIIHVVKKKAITGSSSVQSRFLKWRNPAFRRSSGSANSNWNQSIAKSSKGGQKIKITKEQLQRVHVINQIENSFILGVVDGFILVFDQHAVHERVRLEAIQSKEIQTKTIRATMVTLNEVQRSLTVRYAKQLNHFGFRFSLTATTLTITALPCIDEKHPLDPIDIKEYIQQLEETNGKLESVPRPITRARASVSCKGAIKFGDPLTISECGELISSLALCSVPFQCAHGRPTIVPLCEKPKNDASSLLE